MREHTEEQLRALAYALGATLYLSDGRITTTPGGIKCDPGPKARPQEDHGTLEAKGDGA